MSVAGFKFTALTGGGVGALDAQDGAALAQGDLAIVMQSGVLRLYELNASSGAAESSPSIISPDANAGSKRWIQQVVPAANQVPMGAIIAFMGGYFTANWNVGFTNVIGNTAATINALVNADGWYVCDGVAINIPASTIFNGTGRYLPNITDTRFLTGSSGAGVTGGSNTTSHTHTTGSFTLTTNEMPSHAHGIPTYLGGTGGTNPANTGSETYQGIGKYTDVNGGGASHNHGTTGAPSDTNNAPLFVTCHYLMKVF